MKNLSLVIFALVGSLYASAQETETLFSRGGLGLSGIWYQRTFNFSSFDNDWAYLRGGAIGLEFGRDVFVGWGRYRAQDNIPLASGDNFDLRYNGLVLGIAPGSYRAFHPRISFLTGAGRLELSSESDRDRVFVFQPSAGIEFNIFQWFRLGVEGGYRFVTNNNFDQLSDADVSSGFLQLDLRFGLSWYTHHEVVWAK